MKTQSTAVTIPRNHIVRLALLTGFILLIPLVAMQFSDEWDWSLPDFIIIGTLLFGAGLVYELLASKTRSAKRRLIIGLAVVAIVIVIWAELAVGVFGTPFTGS